MKLLFIIAFEGGADMKEMIYSGNGRTELLHVEWNDHGQALAVVNVRGSHPCGYIQFPGIEKLEDYEDLWIKAAYKDFYIHGGFTFLGPLEHLGLPGIWVGWDYAHLGDWTQGLPPEQDVFSHDDETKYTTEEVVETARKALDFISRGLYTIESENE